MPKLNAGVLAALTYEFLPLLLGSHPDLDRPDNGRSPWRCSPALCSPCLRSVPQSGEFSDTMDTASMCLSLKPFGIVVKSLPKENYQDDHCAPNERRFLSHLCAWLFPVEISLGN